MPLITDKQQTADAVAAGELVSTGTINALFAPVRLDCAALAQMGFAPVATLKAAQLYRSADLPALRAALVQHLTLLDTPPATPRPANALARLHSEAAQVVVLPALRPVQ